MHSFTSVHINVVPHRKVNLSSLFQMSDSSLKDFILSLLPGLTNIDDVITQLTGKGFIEVVDLEYLEPEKDLSAVLNVLQCRKLSAKL